MSDAVAFVIRDDGLEVVRVVERAADGVLVDAVSGVPVELVDVVAVFGLPDLVGV